MNFHLGDILTITTDCFVTPNGMDGVYRILNYMTGDSLMTHQLPRASRECRPALLAQHPDLGDIKVPEFRDEAHVWLWLAQQTERFGDTRDVQVLSAGDHTVIDPLDELRMIRPDMEIIVIEVPE